MPTQLVNQWNNSSMNPLAPTRSCFKFLTSLPQHAELHHNTTKLCTRNLCRLKPHFQLLCPRFTHNPQMPYQVTSADRWETAVYILSSHVSEIENTLSHPAFRNGGSNLWLPCILIFLLFSFQLLHFLSLHPSLPSVTPPPYLGPHSGTQCFPSTGSCLRLISHVVCVSQRSTHTHPSTRNYL